MNKTEREQLAAEHPDAWIPVSAGELLEGTMTDLNISYSPVSGLNFPILTIADDRGVEAKVFCFATALHNEVYSKQPVPGERVTIVYHGTGEASVKGQNAPEIYRLRIHNRSPEAYARMYAQLQPRGRNVPALPPPIPMAELSALNAGSPQT
jgi:hypothetical protein